MKSVKQLMRYRMVSEKRYINIAVYSLLIWASSFLYDGKVFELSNVNIGVYIFSKTVLLISYLMIVFFFYNAFTKRNSIQFRTLKRAIPYLLFEIILLFVRLLA